MDVSFWERKLSHLRKYHKAPSLLSRERWLRFRASWKLIDNLFPFLYKSPVLFSAVQSCPTLCFPEDCSPTRLLCPWDFPGKNSGMGCHFLLQRIFLTQGSNLSLRRLLHWQVGSSPLCQMVLGPTNFTDH